MNNYNNNLGTSPVKPFLYLLENGLPAVGPSLLAFAPNGNVSGGRKELKQAAPSLVRKSGKDFNCLVVLGPTASGKTRLACQLGYELNGEVISADSRQVYKGLDIGTGKDLDEYIVNDRKINYHLVDVIEPTEQFYLHDFVAALDSAFKEITERKKLPIICGGTGLYLDALTKDYSFTQVKEDPELRKQLEFLSKETLVEKLSRYPDEYTGHVDLNSKKRIIRGIEVAEYLSRNGPLATLSKPLYNPYYIVIRR